ncbi:hypothetical protein [Methylobacterium hispanicum]|nr:hypothetical protein [Methylobacterium hispanicum]
MAPTAWAIKWREALERADYNRFYPDVHFQDAADHACLPSSVILY